jgi:ribose-phosphate pyrophosphokinase
MLKLNDVNVIPLKFPGGELHVQIDPLIIFDKNNQIYAHIESTSDVMGLLLLTDAIRQYKPHTTIELVMPYVPYARQDRVANYGESLSIKVFANLINSQGYTKVIISDPHSDVTSALIDRVDVVHQWGYAKNAVSWLGADNTIIISPDAGAMKKAQKLGEITGCPVVCASKRRDTKTGKLSNSYIDFADVDIKDKRLLVVDDIIDGGGTFILLQEAIRKASKEKYGGLVVYDDLNLYVTHGIFSKGTDHILEVYNNVFVAFPFSSVSMRFIIEVSND